MVSFSILSCDKDENRDNIHNPNFMQEKNSVAIWIYLSHTSDMRNHVENETLPIDIVIDWPWPLLFPKTLEFCLGDSLNF